MSQEVIILTGSASVERTLPAGCVIAAASDVPEEGAHNAMLTVQWFDHAHPDEKFGGTGVEIVGTAKESGVYTIAVVPEKSPFSGTLKIG